MTKQYQTVIKCIILERCLHNLILITKVIKSKLAGVGMGFWISTYAVARGAKF